MRFPAEPDTPSGAVPECQIHLRCIFCPPSCKIRGGRKQSKRRRKGFPCFLCCLIEIELSGLESFDKFGCIFRKGVIDKPSFFQYNIFRENVPLPLSAWPAAYPQSVLRPRFFWLKAI